MKRPTDYSRFFGRVWLRETISAAVDQLWRPYRTDVIAMQAETEPVAVITASATDTLWSLAAKYYRGVERPEQLYWLIAEVNDIVDPTESLTGKEITIPPLSLLEDVR